MPPKPPPPPPSEPTKLQKQKSRDITSHPNLRFAKSKSIISLDSSSSIDQNNDDDGNFDDDGLKEFLSHQPTPVPAVSASSLPLPPPISALKMSKSIEPRPASTKKVTMAPPPILTAPPQTQSQTQTQTQTHPINKQPPPPPPQPSSSSSSTSSFDLFESEVNHLLSKNSDTYKVPSELQIFCGTWNVNGKVEEGGNLIAWLESGMTGEVGEPDIFAIGLQELVDLTPGNVLADKFIAGDNSVGAERADEWEKTLLDTLETFSCVHECKYDLLGHCHMVGVLLMVFVKHQHKSEQRISNLQIKAIPTGALGLANKGAAMVSMNFDSTSICFVSSHFAAHLGKVQERNNNFHEISKRNIFLDRAMQPFAKTQYRTNKKRGQQAERRGNTEYVITTLADHNKGNLLNVKNEINNEKNDNINNNSINNNENNDNLNENENAWWDNDLNHDQSEEEKIKAEQHTSLRKSAQFLQKMRQSMLDDDADEDNIQDSDNAGGERAEKAVVEHVEEMGKFSAVDHDIVFWVGDLNYRIKKEIEIGRVYDLLDHVVKDEGENSDEAFAMLLSYDQLNIERREERVFDGFCEGLIDFLPTYKYIPGDVGGYYDRRPDKKMRKPAWCDRILWKVKGRGKDGMRNSESVQLLQYRRVNDYFISDHKPVSALFKVRCKKVDAKKKREMMASTILASLDLQNRAFASVSCTSMFSFKDIDVMTLMRKQGESAWSREEKSFDALDPSLVQTVILENTSNMAKARFKIRENTVPDWVTIHQPPSIIEPSNSVNISASLNVMEIIPGSKRGYGCIVVDVENGNNVVIPVEFNEEEEIENKPLEGVARSLSNAIHAFKM